jgi:peptide/nickel transport system substrate-binding protein
MQQRTKKRDFDAYTGSWVMDYEFDPRALWHSSTASEPESINYIGFKEPEVDKLIESFETDFDEAHRLGTCHAFHQYMHDDEPYTVLFSRTTPVLWWDWMNDLKFFPSNPNRDLRYYSFATARP